MIQTNESSFTEPQHIEAHGRNVQQPVSSSLQKRREIVNGPSSQLNGAAQQILGTNPGQRTKLEQQTTTGLSRANGISNNNSMQDTRSYILMKNKVEGDSKQLKHEVAQQIIATVQKNRIVGGGQIHTCRVQQVPYSQQVRSNNLPSSNQNYDSKIETPQMLGTEARAGTDPMEVSTLNFEERERKRYAFENNLHKQIQQDNIYKNQPPSSQLCKQKNQFQVTNENGQIIQRHNSMELLIQNQSKQRMSRHKFQIQSISPIDTGEKLPQTAHCSDIGLNDSVYKTVVLPHPARETSDPTVQNNQEVTTNIRVISGKRASQPPMLRDQEDTNSAQKHQLLLQAVELSQQHSKRNSIQILVNSRDGKDRFYTQKVPQKMAFDSIQDPKQSPRISQKPKKNFTSERAHNKNSIIKQEIILEGQSQGNSIEQQYMSLDQSCPWASNSKGSDSPFLSRLQSVNMHDNKNKSSFGKQSMILGQPLINIPALQGAGLQFQQHQKQQGKQLPLEMGTPRKADLSESNVKRARLLLDKKKKQFENMPKQESQSIAGIQVERDGTISSTTHSQMVSELKIRTTGLMIGNGMNSAIGMGYPTEAGKPILNLAGNLVCVPGITYKSIIPAQIAQIKQQNALKHFSDHPLNNQQLLNGFVRNTSAAQNLQRSSRRSNQERAIQANQGIQGKPISINNQNKLGQNQAGIMRKLRRSHIVPEEGADNRAMVVRAQESSAYETQHSQDLRNMHQLQQQLLIGNLQLVLTGSRKNLRQSLHAADTGQLPSTFSGRSEAEVASSSLSGKRTSAFFQFNSPPAKEQTTSKGNKVINNVIVFSLNGQTYIRNNDTSYAVDLNNEKNVLSQMEELGVYETDPTDEIVRQNAPLSATQKYSSNKACLLDQQSKTFGMIDQVNQNSIGSRSLSQMLQGAQLEAALQQLAKAGQLGLVTAEDQLETTSCVQQVALLPQPQQSPRIAKTRAKTEKSTKLKFTQSPSKQNSQMKIGESNGSLISTKPATSTTINSTQRKGESEDALNKHSLNGKKQTAAKGGLKATKDGKQRVHIFHEVDEDGDELKTHKINKAINTINNIIRLIFKNNKDSLAITTTNNTSSLSGPSGNRLVEDTRIAELQKIAKQINIQIPKKFDSKQSLREFFHSREFILNLKIKMQNLLHKAILTTNNMPQSIIELNMCGRDASSAGAANGKEESKIYVAKKFWVGPGNNFPIVKSVLKQRYWWQYGSEESFAADCDFIWTSWKKQKHIDFLTNFNNRHRNKAKKQMQQLDGGTSMNENDQKTGEKRDLSSDAKISRKRKDKKDKKNAVADPIYSQDHIDKIVLPLRLYNKLEQNKQLTNKKGVFVNMRKYYESLGQDPFKVLPLTFHTQHGVNDVEFRKFSNYYNALEQKIKQSQDQIRRAIKQYYADKPEKKKSKPLYDDYYEEDALIDSDDEEAIQQIKRKYRAQQNTWIVKPGENTNRGQGITVVKSLRDVQQIIGRPMRKESERTFIIQKYIDYPLLVHKRKFDFRCFGMLTSINGSLKGYCYQDGYVRTSCREYSLEDVTDQFVHLTNDAIQQKAEDYGKFENGNKMSFQDFSKVISAQQPELDFDFQRDIFPQIQKLIADTFKASFHKIDPHRLQNCFELFGYDFMIDENFRLYLIEVNTNPCLEVCCPLLARIIPEVLDNCFKIVLDPLFPSPDLSHNRKFQLNELPQEVKFVLVFDEHVEGEKIRANFLRGVKGSIREASVDEEDIESDKEQELAEDDCGDGY